MAGLTLRPPEKAASGQHASSAAHNKIVEEQIRVMQELTKVVDGLADRTIEGFKSIAEKLNPKISEDEPTLEQRPEASLKHSVDLIVENISEQLKSKPDSAYIIIPGHEYVTNASFENIQKLIEGKNITVVGDISALTEGLNEESFEQIPEHEEEEDDDDDDDDEKVPEDSE
jgi:hypothetical protein